MTTNAQHDKTDASDWPSTNDKDAAELTAADSHMASQTRQPADLGRTAETQRVATIMGAPSLILLALASAMHVACFTIALVSGPSNESFGVLLLAWLCIPSTVSAIGLAPRWQPIITASINGLITATIVDTLLLGFSYFWPFQPKDTQIGLAVAYLLLFPAIAATCGAFVTVIIHAIESAESQPARVTGIQKGTSFAGICALLSLPVFLLLLPVQSNRLVVSFIYIVGAHLLGAIVGALTGWSYQPLRRNPQRIQTTEPLKL